MSRYLTRIAAAIFLTAGIAFAGGDDRAKGPIEPLYAPPVKGAPAVSERPVVSRKVVADPSAKTMTLSPAEAAKPPMEADAELDIPREIERAVERIYETCEDTFDSDNAWIKYSCAIALGILAL